MTLKLSIRVRMVDVFQSCGTAMRMMIVEMILMSLRFCAEIETVLKVGDGVQLLAILLAIIG